MQLRMRLIDANHCPGSAMVHIDGPQGQVLHTGDFRFNGPTMLKNLGNHTFDNVFLDNTFSNPDEDFLMQHKSYRELVRKITTILFDDSNAKIQIYCYTLGKEEILMGLARHFRTKI